MNQVIEKSAKPSPGLRIILPMLVLGVGVLVALWLMRTGPQAKPRPKARNAVLVEVAPVSFAAHSTSVAAMGVVKPSRTVEVKPQVVGKVVAMNQAFIPGSHLKEGEVLVKIDPADALLAVRQLTGDVARTEAEIVLEQGKQLVAAREYELLGEPVSDEERSLMLREPQLASLRAAHEAAEARLDQARLNLERTTVTVPFNALVLERKVDIGTQVGATTTLATLVGSDDYWVEVSVPVSQLRWISVPQSVAAKGSAVRIFDESAWGAGSFRAGTVLRMAPGLEQQGRMARLLVKIEDPLALLPQNAGKPRLLLDAYVRAEIDGAGLPSVATLSREQLRDGDTVWLMNDKDQLEIRKIEIVFRGRDAVLVAGGLEEGERLVVSNLPAAVPGMLLRLPEASGENPEKPGSADSSPAENAGSRSQ